MCDAGETGECASIQVYEQLITMSPERCINDIFPFGGNEFQQTGAAYDLQLALPKLIKKTLQ